MPSPLEGISWQASLQLRAAHYLGWEVGELQPLSWCGCRISLNSWHSTRCWFRASEISWSWVPYFSMPGLIFSKSSTCRGGGPLAPGSVGICVIACKHSLSLEDCCWQRTGPSPFAGLFQCILSHNHSITLLGDARDQSPEHRVGGRQPEQGADKGTGGLARDGLFLG